MSPIRFRLIVCGFLFAAVTVLNVPAAMATKDDDIRELLKLTGMESNMSKMVIQSVDQLVTQYPFLVDSKAKLLKVFEKALSFKAVESDYVKIYADTFNENEVKEMTAFYKTSTGQKAARELPNLFAKGAALGQQRMAAHREELTQIMEEAAKTAKAKSKKGK